jgi:prohibitin 2
MTVIVVAIQVLLVWLPGVTVAQSRGHLGVFIQNTPRGIEGSEGPTAEGVIIIGLMRRSPAEQAGLRRGDIILKVGGQRIRQVEDLQRLVGEAPLGEIIEIEIFRRQQTLIIPVKIEAGPAALPGESPPTPLPVLLPRDELLWVVFAAAGLSLIIVYLASAQPWRRWRPAPGESAMVRASPLQVSRFHILFATVAFLLVGLLWSSLTMVAAGHHGVVFHLFKGVRSETLMEGIHFRLLGLNRVTVYDTRSRLYHLHELTPSSQRPSGQPQDRILWTPTADGLKVGLDLSVRYRLDPGRLPELHRSVGPEFEAKIVHPTVWNVTRLVASEYSLLDIYGKRRHELQQQTFSRVQALFARDGLIAEDLLLREVVYTKEFEKTLVAKMIAEQKVQESSYDVQQAGLRAQVQVIEAQGEAEALELVNRAIRDQPLLLQYLWIKSLPERVRIVVVPNHLGKSTARIKSLRPEAQPIPKESREDGSGR